MLAVCVTAHSLVYNTASNMRSAPLTPGPTSPSLDFAGLSSAYRDGSLSPAQLVEMIFRRDEELVRRGRAKGVWITRLSFAQVQDQVRELEARRAAAADPARELPLYGLPFAVKDNIDCAGVPTTAGCPDYAYLPEQDAVVVAKLKAAGAILIGKTNLDQFATGLVGVRSPYGACGNAFHPDYVSGGSSAGSAVAVALGLASFALGTDTAGSGRVPAAFNNIVGLKPTRGYLSNRGVVPACRTLDCISIFALTCEDAARVLSAAGGFDPADSYSRRPPATTRKTGGAFRFGVPRPDQLEFFGDDEVRRLFRRSVQRLTEIGGIAAEFDFTPFRETAQLLYGGPWVAERLAAIRSFYQSSRGALDPAVGAILDQACSYSAADAFNALYRLEELKRAIEPVWNEIDVLVTPTAPTIYTIKAVQADPLVLNQNLGYYTNFVNLLDLAAISVPAGFRGDGLPAGVTLAAPAWTEQFLCGLGSRLHRRTVKTLGATGFPPPDVAPVTVRDTGSFVDIAVVGAHLSGMPLNRELTRRQAIRVAAARTAPGYRLYLLNGATPAKPGLVQVGQGGAPIEVEIWRMPTERFGDFVAGIPAPLGIGTVTLEDGRQVKGFLCEAFAVAGAPDISVYGGWRRYVTTREGAACSDSGNRGKTS